MAVRYTDNQILTRLRDFCVEFGRTPTIEEWSKHPNLETVDTIAVKGTRQVKVIDFWLHSLIGRTWVL